MLWQLLVDESEYLSVWDFQQYKKRALPQKKVFLDLSDFINLIPKLLQVEFQRDKFQVCGIPKLNNHQPQI